MSSLIQLNLVSIAWALGLMAIAIGLSAWQRLELEWTLAMATVRTLVQLIAVGYVLAVVFTWRNPWAVLAILLVMLTIAAIVARNRISQNVPLLLPWVGGSIFISTVITLSYTNLLVLRPDTWYDPQYVIPLTGILLGNSMNAAAIAGERFVKTLNAQQIEIETYLSLGATPHQAIAQHRKDAIRAGLIPTVNAMMVVGIVTLPGIITGQLLSGVVPLDAALYQILIMFMLACATLISTLLVLQGIYRQFFNGASQLVLH